jgi:hypothetical protein
MMTELEALKKLHRVLHYDSQIKLYHGKGRIADVDKYLDTLIY